MDSIITFIPNFDIEDNIKMFNGLKEELKEDGNLFVSIGESYINGYEMLPEKFAWQMIQNGWILRNKIIYEITPIEQENFSNTYDYILHFVKNKKYYYNLDAIRIPHKSESIDRYKRAMKLGTMQTKGKYASDDRTLIGSPMNAPKWMRENSDKPYSVQERTKEMVEKRENLPTLEEMKLYLKEVRKNKNLTIDEIESIFGNQAPHHWFSGESYPSVDDWKKLKSILDFDDTYDEQMTNVILIPSEKVNNPKGKNPSDYWDTTLEETIKRLIIVSTKENEIVYDPYNIELIKKICIENKRQYNF